MMNSVIKSVSLSALALTMVGLAGLTAGTSEAQAGGWKKFKHFGHHFGYHKRYHYGYYGCRPKFAKVWVWSPRRGRKVLRWVKVGRYCGYRY